MEFMVNVTNVYLILLEILKARDQFRSVVKDGRIILKQMIYVVELWSDVVHWIVVVWDSVQRGALVNTEMESCSMMYE